MKKFLLSAALLTGAFAANADYTEYYKVYYNGEELQNGATVYCDHFEDNTDISGFNMGYTYEANISYVNQTEDSFLLRTSQGFLDMPTEEEFKEGQYDYIAGTMATKWGTPSLCFENGGEDGNESNCIILPFNAVLPDNTHDSFRWQFHLQTISPDTKIAKYTLTTIVAFGDQKDFEEVEDTEFTVNIVFGPEVNGIEGIESDNNATATYFDLQGRRIDNPSQGLYIVKKGNKVTKEFIR
ncbi:MAG: hypothetical protein HDR88_05525 [Bacteroides sp.]|nr:hypothetical protein [Bacteroides sp.]